jgi:integrase
MVGWLCYADFQEIVEAYKKSSGWENLRESSKVAYRKPLERLVEIGMQLPVAVARSRSQFIVLRDEWNRRIRSLKLSNNEKNKMFIVLNAAYEGAGLDKMEFDPLQHEVKETTPYCKEEVEALWKAQLCIQQRIAVAFLRYCFWTGKRPWCEALPTEWEHVHDHLGLIGVVGAKGKEEEAVARYVKILPEVNETLQFIRQLVPARGNVGKVWIQENGRALTKGTVTRWLRDASKSAGVPYRQMYDARRGLATAMLRKGYRLEDVANQLGHMSLETTKRYDQRRKDEKAQAFGGV